MNARQKRRSFTLFSNKTEQCERGLKVISGRIISVYAYFHRRRRQGGWGAAALPTLEKLAKISHTRAENRPKVGQNFRKQLIFYRAARGGSRPMQMHRSVPHDR